MREIKFRAWDGEIMHHVDTIEFPVGGTRWYGPGVGKGICKANPKYDWKEDSILMQFTGFKDKNGKEIYEGDILKTLDYRKKVVIIWDPKQGRFIPDPIYTDYDAPDDDRIYPSILEIVGNIYENPELLQEKKNND